MANYQYDIYVDGSYINGGTGYGAVVLKDGKVVDELCGPVEVSQVNGTRQIAGELVAVQEALRWCQKHSVREVSIYYDYLGIEKWATGRWKTNQRLTQEYARFVRECPIKIHWCKVKSHTGNRWNDRADALAKKGAGLHQAVAERAGISPAAPVETDPVSELLKKTDEWIEFLMVRGIEACFDRVYNDQFARIYIISSTGISTVGISTVGISTASGSERGGFQEDKPAGTFDLYNTKKKRFSPYLHNFRDEGLKVQIENLWKEFCRSSESRRDFR